MSKEYVNHPSWYNEHPSGIECIEVARHCSFNIGNALKYLFRYGRKDDNPEIQDLKKAIFYIQDEINLLEGKYNVTRGSNCNSKKPDDEPNGVR